MLEKEVFMKLKDLKKSLPSQKPKGQTVLGVLDEKPEEKKPEVKKG